MTTLVMVLMILAAAFIIILVLLQPGKADMGATFGGGIGSQMGSMFGTEKTKNILATATKATALFILLLALGTNKFLVGGNYNTPAEQKIVTEGQTFNMKAAPATQAPAAAPQQDQQKK